MRLLIASDAWAPQVSGVYTSLAATVEGLRAQGHAVEVITPAGFRTIPTPTYPEIPLAVFCGREVARRIEAWRPDSVHLPSEGPLGLAARRACLRLGIPFTTAFHTNFAEYVQPRLGIPVSWTNAWLRWFHSPACVVMAGTGRVEAMLRERRFKRVALRTLGVDLGRFHPAEERHTDFKRPVFTYAGRVALEKNLPAFLALDLPGTKLVVGDGPARRALQRRYPAAVFVGMQHGEDLARYYRRSDVFVFPSLTDTFGLVMLEALACGVPVAAFPVPGPLDAVSDPRAGVLDWDLRRAALGALGLHRDDARAHAERFPWAPSVQRFIALQEGAVTAR